MGHRWQITKQYPEFFDSRGTKERAVAGRGVFSEQVFRTRLLRSLRVYQACVENT